MKNQKVGTTLGTIVIVIFTITTGVFVWQVVKNREIANEMPGSVNVEKTITTQNPYQNENTQYGNNQSDEKDLSNSKITTKYTNKTYGFEFEYPQNLVIATRSTDNVFVLSGQPDGIAVFNISVSVNANNFSLDQAFNKELARYKKPERTIVTSAIVVDGKPAKKFSFTSSSDSGNGVVAVVVDGKNIITIYGGDSTTLLKTIFETVLNSFKFIK